MRFSGAVRTSEAPAAAVPAGALEFVSLAALLAQALPEKLDKVRLLLDDLTREDLLKKFRAYFASGQRLNAFLLADSLIKQGIPPAFWHDTLPVGSHTIHQRYDLMVFDLRWLRKVHYLDMKSGRHARDRAMFSTTEAGFHSGAEFAFYGGRRPAWKIVSSLALSESQQMDCYYLRSAPVARKMKAVEAASAGVWQTLRSELLKVRRTVAFTSEQAIATLDRRYALWRCGQMSKGSPTETARRYCQLTGETLTRQVAAKQLEKISETLLKKSLAARLKSEMI